MRCPECGAESPDDKRFCADCGAPLTIGCPSCGVINPRQQQFCRHCGASLATPDLRPAPAPEAYPPRAQIAAAAGGLNGEIKQVTVLFCDIVNSTALTERLGAEAMLDLVNHFLDLSIAEIRRYGGTVPEFTGDGFMAVFGAPRAYEDHVRRALLAGLGIRRVLTGERGAASGWALGLPVRIGIHSGPVVFGPLAGSLGVETVIGDTANVAARLQQAAEPGAILLGDTTWALAQGFARAQPLGPLTLKGKADPISAYRLLDVSRSQAGDRAGPMRATDFVDRVDALAALLSYVEEAETGHGRLIEIVGEPGIGKSRIVEEMRRRLLPGRLNWVEGRCDSYGMAIPYLLVLDLLRSYCGIVETDAPDAIIDKIGSGLRAVGMNPDQDAAVLLHLLGVNAVNDPLLLSRAEAIKEKAFNIFHQFTINGSRRRPLALVVEDLHWIDKLSAEFLQAISDYVANTRILIIATYRPGVTAPWAGKTGAAQIALQPLSSDDSRHVVRSISRGTGLADPVAAQIVAKADGNPLFLQQLALHAGEAKNIHSELLVPATIRDVIMARIDRLPREAKQLLQTAAVIGREFSLHLLNAVWTGSGSIDPPLRELCHLEFLDERIEPEGVTYVFHHALAQEAAYGSLLERQRRATHGRIGSALKALYQNRTDEVAELLALHFARSDEAEQAVDYAIAAAVKAGRGSANAEALNYFNTALARLDAMPDTTANRLRRVDAVLKQAEVKFALGRQAEHIAALEDIRSMVEATDDPRRRATWHYWTGFLHSLTGGRPVVAIDHCNKAALLAGPADSEIKAYAESCLAQVYTIAGRLRDAVAMGEAALASFEAQGNPWWAGRTLWHLTVAANGLGEWESSLDYCRRALDHGIALNDLRLKVVGWLRMGSAHIQRGDLERGSECCNRALDLAPNPFDTAMAKGIRGYGKIKAGLVDAGIAELSEAVAWFESSDLRYTYLHQALWLAEGHLRRGDRSLAKPLIEEVLNTSRTMGYLHFEGRARWLISECIAAEASVRAVHEVKEAINIFNRAGARNDLGKAMITLAGLCQTNKDFEGARQLYLQALQVFRILGTSDEVRRVAAVLEGQMAEENRASPGPPGGSYYFSPPR